MSSTTFCHSCALIRLLANVPAPWHSLQLLTTKSLPAPFGNSPITAAAAVRVPEGAGRGAAARVASGLFESANTIKLSPLSFVVSPTFRRCAGPPATIATYCYPFRRPCQLIGVALPLAASGADHTISPVFESNARNIESFVAATQTRPPAVAMVPPAFGVPAFFRPSASMPGNEPSGTFHAMSPVFTFTAVSSPHGGCWHG